MRNIELYISGQRVDLFNDESVTIKDSIQDVKDIEKVFTSFSKSFNIPASKTNNKLFKHYYNFDIDNGFDARIKVDSTIEINSLTFKFGKVKLEGVNLKYNKPHTYRITFFGSTVDLKDKLGESKLSDLDLTEYDLDYNAQTVKTYLADKRESNNNHIIVPLITHTQRLFYDSSSHDEKGDGNLYWDTGHIQDLHGVKWNELKYAIRVNKIIEAIENDFGLQFSTDFFKNIDNERFDHLFLWLHRKSGKVEDLSGGTKVDTLVNAFKPISTTGPIYNRSGYVMALVFKEDILEWKVRLEPVNLTQVYTVTFRDTSNNIIYRKENHKGNLTVFLEDTFEYGLRYYLWIEASGQVSFNNIRWSIRYRDITNLIYDVQFNTGTYQTSLNFRFNVAKQMPNIKILDFLTGLFKTFNLTAYEQDGIIVVKPLDDFYAEFNTYNIDEYVDVSSSTVDIALPYKEVVFKFKDTKSFLANKYGELQNKEWGELKYSDNTPDLVGGIYKIEVPFGHMMYENIVDPNTNFKTNIQWGYSVNDSQSAYLGSPLLFYPKWGALPFNISFVDEVDENGKPISHRNIAGFNKPLNSQSTNSSFNPFNFNFALEPSEYTGGTGFNETLFTEYYSEYINSVFNPKQRITKISAYLPLRILLNYKLSDRFAFKDNIYRINSITTNLQTGKSQLELLNDL
jgi:hypothetical protein